jgi:hypothetical protein
MRTIPPRTQARNGWPVVDGGGPAALDSLPLTTRAHTMATPVQTAIPGYALAPPTEQDALGFLARALGPDQAASLWVRTCRDAGVRSGALGPDEMERAAQALAAHEGVAGVIGNSLVIRLRTYRLLARTRQPEGGR